MSLGRDGAFGTRRTLDCVAARPKQISQSALIVLLGIPTLLLLIAFAGWIASLIYTAFTGQPPPDM